MFSEYYKTGKTSRITKLEGRIENILLTDTLIRAGMQKMTVQLLGSSTFLVYGIN